MSATILREAAALMRSRAEAATAGSWEASHRLNLDWLSQSAHVDASRHEPGSQVQTDAILLSASVWPHCQARANAEHIASWHPAIALAVADWLDWCADRCDRTSEARLRLDPEERAWVDPALAVARAYLGRDA